VIELKFICQSEKIRFGSRLRRVVESYQEELYHLAKANGLLGYGFSVSLPERILLVFSRQYQDIVLPIREPKQIIKTLKEMTRAPW
jgi:hypothetical protein